MLNAFLMRWQLSTKLNDCKKSNNQKASLFCSTKDPSFFTSSIISTIAKTNYLELHRISPACEILVSWFIPLPNEISSPERALATSFACFSRSWSRLLHGASATFWVAESKLNSKATRKWFLLQQQDLVKIDGQNNAHSMLICFPSWIW